MKSIDDFTRPLEYITPLDKILGAIIRDWAEKEVIPHHREFDEGWKNHSYILPPLRKLMGDCGFQRIAFPEDLGGWGLGASSYTYGADRDWDVDKHWRDLKMLQLVEGGKQLSQMEAARWFYDCVTI